MKLIGTLVAGLLLTHGAAAQQLDPFQDGTVARPQSAPVVIKVIGDEIITYAEVVRALQQLGSEGKLVTEDDFERERDKAFMNLIELKLQAQAGRDLGFSRDLVERIVKDSFNRRVEGWGGRAKAGEMLEEGGVTPDEFKEVLEKQVLARAWRNAKTGMTAGATGRVEVDRYVRPGQQYNLFQQLKNDPRYLERLGGQPERAVIQELLLMPSSQNDLAAMDSSFALGVHLKGLIESGESTFAELDAIHGPIGRAEETIGREPQPLAIHRLENVSLARHGGDQLFVFAQSAELGAVSDPLLHALADGRKVVTFYRLIRRLPSEPASFTAPGTQRALEEELLKVLDERRLEAGMRLLQRHTFHWPDQDDLPTPAEEPAEQP